MPARRWQREDESDRLANGGHLAAIDDISRAVARKSGDNFASRSGRASSVGTAGRSDTLHKIDLLRVQAPQQSKLVRLQFSLG
jgi:hypothetical protein